MWQQQLSDFPNVILSVDAGMQIHLGDKPEIVSMVRKSFLTGHDDISKIYNKIKYLQ